MESITHQSAAPRRWPIFAALGSLFVLTVAGAFGWHWYVESYRPILEARERAAQAVELVRASMSDPAGAQFRNVRGYGTKTCGEVNGKNLFGAYVGFKPFIADPASAVPVSVDSDARSQLAAELCRLASERFPADQ